MIASIWNEQGERLTNPEQVQQEFLSFFKGLQGTCVDEMSCLDINIAKDGPCLTRAQQQQILQLVTRQEILNALNDLPNDKAPKKDGFNVEFFKKYWELIGEDVILAVSQFFKTSKLLKEGRQRINFSDDTGFLSLLLSV